MAKDTQTYREDEGSASKRYANGQVKQAAGQDLSPADGADGYVGSNTGPALGMNVVSGKKGYSTDRPIWSEKSSGDDQDMSAPETKFGGQDSTDERASYKRVQTDEGLPQTFRTAYGAGDAGPYGSDEPDKYGADPNKIRTDTQSIPSSDYAGDTELAEMPQTEFTHNDGGGAPVFKRGR